LAGRFPFKIGLFSQRTTHLGLTTQHHLQVGSIHIGSQTFIANNALILPQATIGNQALIGPLTRLEGD
jgi:acetyltransferase-like isoleucine patch superfamily enzyme